MALTKSATSSRAWPWPLRGAFLIPPALLVVADFRVIKPQGCAATVGFNEFTALESSELNRLKSKNRYRRKFSN